MSPYRSPADMPEEPADIPKDRNVVVVGPAALCLIVYLIGIGSIIRIAIAVALGH